jgi:predicted transcriptional regulator
MDKLILPQELEVWYVLPAIRRELALAMIASGLPQKKAAQLLNVTEAAVSQYKKEKRANQLTFDNTSKSMVQEAVTRITNNQTTAFSEIMRIDDHLKKSGIFCKLHRSKSTTPENCEAACNQHFFKSKLPVIQ